jgi:hypothetical protein
MLIFFPVVLFGQAEKFMFQVKDEKLAVRKNLVLIANGESVITNTSGIFIVTLSNNISNVAVQSPDEKKICYPLSSIGHCFVTQKCC